MALVQVLVLVLELALAPELERVSVLVSVLVLAPELEPVSELALAPELEQVSVLALEQVLAPLSKHLNPAMAYLHPHWSLDHRPESTTELCSYGLYK